MYRTWKTKHGLSSLKSKDWHVWIVFGILCAFIPSVISVASNLHTYDGISNGDIIGYDIFFEIVDPEELGYTYRIRPAKDFGVPFNDSIYVQAIPLVPVDPPSGCGWPNNAEELKGSVALVERGECSFLSKAVRAQDVGARAVIITDNNGDVDYLYIEMVDDNTHREVNIPAGYLVGKNGYMIRQTLERMNMKHALINIPVNLTYVETHKINQPPWVGW